MEPAVRVNTYGLSSIHIEVSLCFDRFLHAKKTDRNCSPSKWHFTQKSETKTTVTLPSPVFGVIE